MPLQIQNWQGREGAIQLCSFEAVKNKAFICDECGIHEDGSVPTIWCEFPQGHKDNLSYHKECFITILRKATKDKNVARCVEDDFRATMLKNIRASYKEEDIKVTTVAVSIPMIEQLSEAEPVIQQLSDTKAENQSLKQSGFSLEDLGASDESAMKEMLRKATKKKKNHYTKQKQEEEPEDEPSINPDEDAPSSRPEMKPQGEPTDCLIF
ncbi:hypothetical protein RHSIM_Rhsim05G0009500 [Rhododendron simsii]|uniref:Uncharacterized protein n=1 Tax=Rhododendron simsii TaxID=118357 RepID=A0A834GU79_RHOSS|nr:hypothetical protein RHSIM_Rhsim05G0009500 [Rhododendron simsii]